MTKEPTLLFCLGATKASTTWLYKVLSRHPDCHLRSIKELHFFGSQRVGRLAKRADELQSELGHLLVEHLLRPNRMLAARIADMEAWIAVLRAGTTDAYLAYMTQGLAAHRLVADMTPSYALLPVDRLQHLASLLPDVRFVYLMRDPVARLWSHVRMSAFRRGGDLATQAATVFDAVMNGTQKDVSNRGDYKSAIARFDAAIAPSKLLVMFQEVLMTIPGMNLLCSFLGIAQHDADFSNRVHLGPQLDMTTDQLLRARAALRPQYEFAAARFGSLPEPWLRNMGKGVA